SFSLSGDDQYTGTHHGRHKTPAAARNYGSTARTTRRPQVPAPARASQPASARLAAGRIAHTQPSKSRGRTDPVARSEKPGQALIKAGGYDNSFACSFVKGTRNCYFNAVNFSDSGDITSFQEGSSPAVVSDIWQWKGNFAKTHGRHTFSMGADFNTNGFQQTF